MNYLKLKNMCKKCKGNAVMSIFGICILFLIGFASSNPGLATELVLGITVVVLTAIIPIIICAIKLYHYLKDDMNKVRMEEEGIHG